MSIYRKPFREWTGRDYGTLCLHALLMIAAGWIGRFIAEIVAR
jgi:hypothetical protein